MANSPGRRTAGTGTRTLIAWTILLALVASQSFTTDQHVLRQLAAPTAEGAAASRRSHPGRSPAEMPVVKLDSTTVKFRSTDDENNIADRFHALAPALDVVRAPLEQPREPTGLSAQHNARLLQDWEVENIVLLATIDGAIHARDRKTGLERWTLGVQDSPMIETVHHRFNHSNLDDSNPEDDYIFIVEPTKDGNIYIQHKDPKKGLQRLGITVRSLAAQTPQWMENPSIVTNAEQSSALYMIDAASGNILKQFDKQTTFVNDNQDRSCRRISGFDVDDAACEPFGTLVLGRLTFTITISSGETSEKLCTIKYSEWTPNTRDSDLQSQHFYPLDHRHIESHHDGTILGIDRSLGMSEPYRFVRKLETPVARVFDVVRPKDTSGASAPLTVLSQPTDQGQDTSPLAWYQGEEKGRVFVNQTEAGGWYAMSEVSYPGVTLNAGLAKLVRGIDTERSLIDFETDFMDLIGVHNLAPPTNPVPVIKTLDGPRQVSDIVQRPNADVQSVETPQPPSLNLESLSGLSPTAFACLLVAFALALSNRSKMALTVQDYLGRLGIQVQFTRKAPTSQPEHISILIASEAKADHEETPSPPHSRSQSAATVSITEDQQDDQLYDFASDAESEDFGRDRAKSSFSNPEQDIVPNGDKDEQQEDVKKKKAKRGKRGGKKNKKKTVEPEAFDENVDRVVDEKKLSNGELLVGKIRVDSRMETSLGHGSNGTTVLPGWREGRQVAVKRMLKSTNSLAAREIQHLLSSDDHPNVIRYFGKEESPTFTYIALDLFTCSLDQVVQHPERYPNLVSMTDGLDVNDTLCQITYGVQHLHSLKLVHRDVKPQNVLVRPQKSQRATTGPPKLHFVISDFGLCKTLDEGPVSTFAPTANHTAAGTSGWRAPELLVGGPSPLTTGDPASSERSNPTSTSTDAKVSEGYTARRATKAIDIFSLGCVFFYVMTQGHHPFDVGGSTLARDLNIKEDNFGTDQLRLFDYSFEADDLIMQMLKHDARERPNTLEILHHPYFWSVGQKLNFLCDVSDHYESEKNKTDTVEMQPLEDLAPNVIGKSNDFLRALPRNFLTEVGKQRKYTGSKMIDLLRMIRNKRHHFLDLPDDVKEHMLGGSDAGYYKFWSQRFPSLLINCHCLILERGLVEKPQLQKYFE